MRARSVIPRTRESGRHALADLPASHCAGHRVKAATSRRVAICPRAGMTRSGVTPRVLLRRPAASRSSRCRSRRTSDRPASSVTTSSRNDSVAPQKAQGCVELGALERMVLEVERHHAGVGRDRVDALLAARAEQLQRGAIVELRVVELRDRRGVHDVAAVDAHGIGVGRRDMAVARDVLVELDVHDAVFARARACARVSVSRGSRKRNGSGIGT